MDVQRQARVMGLLLYVFAAWTLMIKFVLPIAWAVSRGEPLGTYIWKDAWWVAHLLVGWGLRRPAHSVWPWAFGLAVVETVIIVVKFALYIPNPVVDFWHINWLINKSFMLVYFVGSLFWLARPAVRRYLSST